MAKVTHQQPEQLANSLISELTSGQSHQWNQRRGWCSKRTRAKEKVPVIPHFPLSKVSKATKSDSWNYEHVWAVFTGTKDAMHPGIAVETPGAILPRLLTGCLSQHSLMAGRIFLCTTTSCRSSRVGCWPISSSNGSMYSPVLPEETQQGHRMGEGYTEVMHRYFLKDIVPVF